MEGSHLNLRLPRHSGVADGAGPDRRLRLRRLPRLPARCRAVGSTREREAWTSHLGLSALGFGGGIVSYWIALRFANGVVHICRPSC